MRRIFAPFSSPVASLCASQTVEQTGVLRRFRHFRHLRAYARMYARFFRLHAFLFPLTRTNYTKMTKMTKKAIQVFVFSLDSFCITWAWVTKMTKKEGMAWLIA